MNSIPLNDSIASVELAPLMPGHGWFAARMSGIGRKELVHKVREALKNGVPLHTAYGRRHPSIGGDMVGRVYALVREEASRAYAYAKKCINDEVRMPIINAAYLHKWCQKYGMQLDEVLAQMGVANKVTRIYCTLTDHAGLYLLAEHSSEEVAKAFASYWGEKRVSRIDRTEMLADVAILTALQRMDRKVLYRQIVDAMQLPCNDTRNADNACVYEGLHTDVNYTRQTIAVKEPVFREGQRIVLPVEGKERQWNILSPTRGVTTHLAAYAMLRPTVSTGAWGLKIYKTPFDELYGKQIHKNK